MKSLYNKDFRYIQDATSLSNEVNAAIKPIFEKYRNLGYSPREISHLMMGDIQEMELYNILFGGESK